MVRRESRASLASSSNSLWVKSTSCPSIRTRRPNRSMTSESSGASEGLAGLTAVACSWRRRAASASRRAGEFGETIPLRRGRSGLTAAAPWARGGRGRVVPRPVAAKGRGLSTETVVRPSRAATRRWARVRSSSAMSAASTSPVPAGRETDTVMVTASSVATGREAVPPTRCRRGAAGRVCAAVLLVVLVVGRSRAMVMMRVLRDAARPARRAVGPGSLGDRRLRRIDEGCAPGGTWSPRPPAGSCQPISERS